MQITNKTTEKITTVTYEVTTDYHGDVIYIDYYDENGRVVDSILRDSDGNDMFEPSLMEDIQDLLAGTDLVDLSN